MRGRNTLSPLVSRTCASVSRTTFGSAEKRLRVPLREPFFPSMPHVPGLRSPYAKVGRLVYFGRMLDKIRLHAAGALPADYLANLGDTKPGMFDTRLCQFLRVDFASISRRTLEGGTDQEVLDWAEAGGAGCSDEDCTVWNGFLSKRARHDSAEAVQRLRQRVAESGLENKPIQTFFEYIDFDEGRDPVAARAWEKISIRRPPAARPRPCGSPGRWPGRRAPGRIRLPGRRPGRWLPASLPAGRPGFRPARGR